MVHSSESEQILNRQAEKSGFLKPRREGLPWNNISQIAVMFKGMDQRRVLANLRVEAMLLASNF